MSGPDDLEQPCPHGDYRSCVVDGCLPLRRALVAGVVVPPPDQVPCMWCGAGSPRGQCSPCSALLDAIHAASRAGFVAMVEAFAQDESQPKASEVLSNGDLVQLHTWNLALMMAKEIIAKSSGIASEDWALTDEQLTGMALWDRDVMLAERHRAVGSMLVAAAVREIRRLRAMERQLLEWARQLEGLSPVSKDPTKG